MVRAKIPDLYFYLEDLILNEVKSNRETIETIKFKKKIFQNSSILKSQPYVLPPQLILPRISRVWSVSCQSESVPAKTNRKLTRR